MKKESIESIINIASEINTNYLNLHKNDEGGNRFSKLFIFIIVIFLLSSVLAILNKLFFNSELIRVLSLSSLIISQILAYMIIIKNTLLPIIKLIKKTPYIALLNNIKDAATVDSNHLDKLKSHSINSLEFMLNHFKEEIKRLDNVSSLLLGAVKKIGLFPSIVAAFIAMDKLQGISAEWASASIYIYPGLYFVTVVLFSQDIGRLERMITLLEFTIKSKQEKFTTEKPLN